MRRCESPTSWSSIISALAERRLAVEPFSVMLVKFQSAWAGEGAGKPSRVRRVGGGARW